MVEALKHVNCKLVFVWSEHRGIRHGLGSSAPRKIYESQMGSDFVPDSVELHGKNNGFLKYAVKLFLLLVQPN